MRPYFLPTRQIGARPPVVFPSGLKAIPGTDKLALRTDATLMERNFTTRLCVPIFIVWSKELLAHAFAVRAEGHVFL